MTNTLTNEDSGRLIAVFTVLLMGNLLLDLTSKKVLWLRQQRALGVYDERPNAN